MVGIYGFGDIDRVIAARYATETQTTYLQSLGGNGEVLKLVIFDRRGLYTPELVLQRFKQFQLEEVLVYTETEKETTIDIEGIKCTSRPISTENRVISMQIRELVNGKTENKLEIGN